ncbi:MAG TPA: GNAT family N-acetyltransferase [Beijerinckiaceae bacterium]|jgi:GNAT superfamily N-acetyltransferase|nr:family N-acetyltransferase [Microvirga sp.]HZB36895.1 GNAT family N-acetyltransferase [Beijerinckiaceae bacterium]
MSVPEPVLRPARREDVPRIVALFTDDELGRSREGAPLETYLSAFDAIEADRNNTVYVLDLDGELSGCAQLTVIPGLGRRGMRHAQIEAVRVASHLRGRGHGRWLIGRLVEMAREKGCGMVQLTSDKRRTEAHRFYGSLGFVASHEGFKLALD